MALAYLDTNSGIAGDMTLAALVDAGADRRFIEEQVRSLGLGQVSLRFSETARHCFRALRLDVEHPPEHAHRHLSDIEAMIERSELGPRERDMALRLFRRIGTAEAKVHGTTIEQVHFHEVGAVDSIVDIVGTAVAICQLNIQRIIAAPPCVGAGTIRIAHGTVSVPAPATAELLKGVPIRGTHIQAELTTPTGAAILATLADGFGPLPDMQIQRIGYGAGHKELEEQANILRVMIGEPVHSDRDQVVVLETNLDDVTGEQLGFAIEQIWKLGALDVYTTAIGMKKNRPGVLLTVIGRPEQRGPLEDCLFEHSGSLGIRRSNMPRRKLARDIIRVQTPVGEARAKVAWQIAGSTRGSDQVRIAPEYEDCRRLASESGRSLESIFQLVKDAAVAQATRLPPMRDATPSQSQAVGTSPPRTELDHDHHHDHHDGHDHHHDHDHHHGHDHHDHDHHHGH
jgi:uncharacterized protein (TIGR00299 family) protein